MPRSRKSTLARTKRLVADQIPLIIAHFPIPELPRPSTFIPARFKHGDVYFSHVWQDGLEQVVDLDPHPKRPIFGVQVIVVVRATKRGVEEQTTTLHLQKVIDGRAR